MDANSIADVLDLVSRALRQYAGAPASLSTPSTGTTVAEWKVPKPITPTG